MSKKTGPTKVNLADFKERKENEGAIDIEMPDGQTFRIPPPELWPDEVADYAEKREIVAMAEAILGAERFAEFKTAGGSATIINAIFAEHHGADAGK